MRRQRSGWLDSDVFVVLTREGAMTASSIRHVSEIRSARDPLYASLIGLTSLVVLLQGLWAGLFIREGKDFDASSAQANWVEVHDTGARIAIVLAFVSFVVAVWRLRARKDLLVGTGALFVLLAIEAYIGGGGGGPPGRAALPHPPAGGGVGVFGLGPPPGGGGGGGAPPPRAAQR